MKFKINAIEDYCYKKALEAKAIYEKVYGWGHDEVEEKAIQDFKESLELEYSKLPQSERKIVEKYIGFGSYDVREDTDDNDEIIDYIVCSATPRTSDVMFFILPLYWRIKFFLQKIGF